MKNYKVILSVLATLITIAGVDLDYYVLSQRAADLQKRMRELEDRNKCSVREMPEHDRQAYRAMELERQNILRKIEMIRSKK